MCITMDLLNKFRGLKKSSSDTKLGDRLSFVRRSKTSKSKIQASPLPPRPSRPVGRILENVSTDHVNNVASLHSPRHDTDQFGNHVYTPLMITGDDDPGDDDADDVSTNVSEDDPGRCSSCGQEYDSGSRRMLVDSCGHERCHACMLSMTDGCEECRGVSSSSQRLNWRQHQRPSTVNIDESTMSGMIH